MATEISLDNIQWVNCSINETKSERRSQIPQLSVVVEEAWMSATVPSLDMNDLAFTQNESFETASFPWKTLAIIAELPNELDLASKLLLRHWLSQRYWQTTDELLQRYPPSPPETHFEQDFKSHATLHLALPGSGLEQQTLFHEGNSAEQQAVEVAAAHHRFAVMKAIDDAMTRLSPSDQDKTSSLLSTMMCLATLEYRFGDRAQSFIYFETTRRLMRQAGGPLKLKDRRTERFAQWFECVHAISKTSLAWDVNDVQIRLDWLILFLDGVARNWQCKCSTSAGMVADSTRLHQAWNTQRKKPFLKSNSLLWRLLTRDPLAASSCGSHDIRHLSAQLSCIVLYAIYLVKVCCDQPGGETSRAHLVNVEEALQSQGLTDQHSVFNLAWVILADAAELPEAESSKRRWHVAAMMNVVKYMNYTWQSTLKNWLLRYIRGDSFVGPIRIDRFVFSYDAAAFHIPTFLNAP